MGFNTPVIILMVVDFPAPFRVNIKVAQPQKELETLTRQDIKRQKERLFKMYEKELITYEELIFLLNKLDEPPLKEPPTIY